MKHKNIFIFLFLLIGIFFIGINEVDAITFEQCQAKMKQEYEGFEKFTKPAQENLMKSNCDFSDNYDACMQFNNFIEHIDPIYCEQKMSSGNFGTNIACVIKTTTETNTYRLISSLFTYIKYIVPALLLILCVVDIVKAVTAGDDKGIKKAQGDAIKRVVASVIIYLIPTIVRFILELIGSNAGDCGIS